MEPKTLSEAIQQPSFEHTVAYAIEKEVEREVKKAVENAKAELDRRIPRLVAGLSISLLQQASFEYRGSHLCISVRLEDFRT